MKESINPKSKNATFHVWIVWDPVEYLSPYLAMKSLQKITKKKSGETIKTPLTCPEPKIRKYQTLYKVLKFITQYSHIILLIGFISLIILGVLYFSFDSRDFHRENEQEDQQIVNEDDNKKNK